MRGEIAAGAHRIDLARRAAARRRAPPATCDAERARAPPRRGRRPWAADRASRSSSIANTRASVGARSCAIRLVSAVAAASGSLASAPLICVLRALAQRRRGVGIGEHRDRAARPTARRRCVAVETSTSSSRRAAASGFVRERVGEQRAAAIAEAAHRRERDPAQLGIASRSAPSTASPGRRRCGAARRCRRPRPPRAAPRATASSSAPSTSCDLGRRAARDRPQRGEQLGEILGILRRLAQRVERRLVAGGRVVDEAGELRRHQRRRARRPSRRARRRGRARRSSSTPRARPSRASARCRRPRCRSRRAARRSACSPARPPRTTT